MNTPNKRTRNKGPEVSDYFVTDRFSITYSKRGGAGRIGAEFTVSGAIETPEDKKLALRFMAAACRNPALKEDFNLLPSIQPDNSFSSATADELLKYKTD